VDALGLVCRSTSHQHYTVDDLQSYILFPYNHNKLRVYYEDGLPIGLVTWAWLSPERANDFLLGKVDLEEEDYVLEKTEGYQLWGIEFISPYKKARKIMPELRKECLLRYGPELGRFRRFANPTKERKGRII